MTKIKYDIVDLSLLKVNDTVMFRNGGTGQVEKINISGSLYAIKYKNTSSKEYNYTQLGYMYNGGNCHMLDIISYERLPDNLDKAKIAYDKGDNTEAIGLIIQHLRSN